MRLSHVACRPLSDTLMRVSDWTVISYKCDSDVRGAKWYRWLIMKDSCEGGSETVAFFFVSSFVFKDNYENDLLISLRIINYKL